MSTQPDAPRPLSPEDADLVAEKVVGKLIAAVTDPHTVDRVTEAWSGSLDKMIGRGIRRLAGTVVVALLLWGGLKFELFGKLLGLK